MAHSVMAIKAQVPKPNMLDPDFQDLCRTLNPKPNP